MTSGRRSSLDKVGRAYRRQPSRDKEGLAEIHGIGPAFLEHHGDEVLELLAA